MAFEIFKMMGTIAINKDEVLQGLKAVQDGAQKTATAIGSSFEKATKYVEAHSAQFKKVGKDMLIVGGVITATLGLIIKQTVDTGDAFNDMSLRTGVAVEDLSALAYAGKQTGTSIDAIELSLKFLTRAMDDASKGTGTAKDTFTALGISVTDTEGKLRPVVDVMKDIATKVAAIDDPTKQAALAMELFGARSGTDLLPLLKLGGAGIVELMKKAEELGIVMSTESAQAADEFKDRMNDLKEVLGATGRDVADVLIPPVLDLINKATVVVNKIREWADAHKSLVDMLVKVVAVLGPVLIGLGSVLIILPKLVTGVHLLTGALPGLAAAFSPFLIGAAIALGFIALIKYMQDLREEAYKTQIGLDKMSLIDLDIKIADIASEIIGLEEELKSIDWGTENVEIATVKSLEYQTQIANLKEQLGIFKGQRDAVTAAEKEAIIVTETLTGATGAGIPLTEELAKATQTLGDRIYQLTHTEMEYNIKKLYEQAQAYIDLGVPMEDVVKWVDLEQEAMYKLNIVLNTVTNSWADFRKMDSSGMLADNAAKLQTLADGFKSMNTDLGNLNKTGLQIAIDNLEKMAAQFLIDGQNAELVAKWLKAMKEELISLDAVQNNAKISAADFWKIEREGATEFGELALTVGARWKVFFDDLKAKYRDTTSAIQTFILNVKNAFESALGSAIYSLFTMASTNAQVQDEMAQAETDRLDEVTQANEDYKQALITQLAEYVDAKTLSNATIGELESLLKQYSLTQWTEMSTNAQDQIQAINDKYDEIGANLEKKQVTIGSILLDLWKALVDAILIELARIAAFWIVGLIFRVSKGGGIGYKLGGKIEKYDIGGRIKRMELAHSRMEYFQTGGPKGTDTVPIWATPGEYMISKPMTDFIRRTGAVTGSLIKSIQTGSRTPAPGFAGGGTIPSIVSNPMSNQVNIENISVSIFAQQLNDETISRAGGKIFVELKKQLGMRGLVLMEG